MFNLFQPFFDWFPHAWQHFGGYGDHFGGWHR
jgi:hypothetical protein